jgi:hypothetical protein
MRIRSARRVWTILSLLPLAPIAFICDACSSRPTRNESASAQEPNAMTVYINVHGDPRLVHRFSTFLRFSLEDAGISHVSSESEANVFVEGNLTAQTQTRDIGVGIVRAQLTQNGNPTNMEMCATLNSEADGELFNGAAESIASKIRGKSPNARTIKLDATSDTKVSNVFNGQLPSALKNADFEVIVSGTPDVLLHIDLLRQKVAVEERVAELNIEVRGRDAESPGSTSGKTIISAKLAAPPPKVCPEQFEDLSWLAGNSLYNDADMLAKNLRKHPPKVKAQ